jgi:PKD repeat protein
MTTVANYNGDYTMKKTSIISKKKLMGTNVSLSVNKVHATYDLETDDWFIDRLESIDQVIDITSATQTEVCNKLKLSTKRYICFVSTNDIFVLDRLTNQPKFCLKKVEKIQ